MALFDFFFTSPTPDPAPPEQEPVRELTLPEAQTPDLHPDPIIRGQRAENLLADPMLKAAFESARNKYRREWEAAGIDELDQQRHAHMKFWALKDVLKEINAHITNAAFVKAKNEAEAKRELAKGRVG